MCIRDSRYDKLTVKAQEALQEAQELAAQNGQQQIELSHLLLALARQKDRGVVPALLARLGVSINELDSDLQNQIAKLPKVSGSGQQHMSTAVNEALGRAADEADRFKDEYVSTEHMLLGISSAGRDPAAELLKKHGATHDAILQALVSVRGSQRVTSQNPEMCIRDSSYHLS